MQRDLNQTPAGTSITCDICVIGSGPAGITIARALNGLGAKVLLLESGGFDNPDDAQALNDGLVEPSPLPNLPPKNYPSLSRARYFGGASNKWGGWCRPLEIVDFAQRDWVPLSGWPISRDTLASHYAQAAQILKLPPFELGKEQPAYSPGSDYIYSNLFTKPMSNPEVLPRYFRITEASFTTNYKDELIASANVEVVTNANVIRLDCEHAGSKVSSAQIVNQRGENYQVVAKIFVLACGGLENPRILLNSNAQRPAGLGNENGLVGRYFMEHPHANFGLFSSHKGNAFIKLLLFDPKIPFFVFTTSYEFQKRERTMNFCTTLGVHDSPLEQEDKVLRLMRGIGKAPSGTTALNLYVRGEMEPVYSNHVKLAAEADAFGVKKISIGFTYSDRDRLSIKKSMMAVLRFLSYHGIGRGRLNIKGEDAWTSEVNVGCHHMGTTRMASDPSKGVVDANCKVHSLDNLYIGGSSVFPTSGFANPTFTIIALANRIAQTIRSKV